MGRPVVLAACFASVVAASHPPAPQLLFHHLHLNDSSLQEFYARLFDPAITSQTPVGGYAALRSGPMLMLFGKAHFSGDATPVPPPGETTVWHFGWGAVSLGETYLQHAARDVQWEAPLPAGRLHLHLVSKSPPDTAAWYRDRLGARVEVLHSATDPARTAAARPEQRVAEAVVYFGDFALAIYRTNQSLVSTRGKRVDHFALIAEGARFGETPASMIEGPDAIQIELIGAAPRPQQRD